MTGRGRGGSRAPRKGGRFHNRNTANRQEKPKKTINDYTYYLGSAKQASDYEATTEFLINHVKKTFNYGNDIGTALESLSPLSTDPWKPSMQVSVSSEEAVSQMENKQFEIEFKADYDEYRKRVLTYENNLIKAYALIWERCSKGMTNKIESRSNYGTIKNDPIELLKAIKEHALNYQEHRYSMSIILDSIRNLINTTQKENEGLQEFTKRFKVAQDVMESHVGGPIILTKYAQSMSDYSESDQAQQTKCQKKAFNQFLAYLYLENADQSKYGSILAGLNTQQSLGNNQYPKTIAEANNVLSNHKIDKSSKNDKPGKKKNDKKEDEPAKEREELVLSFAQMEGCCYCCGKPGHMSPQCRHKNRPKEEWAINKAQQHMNAQENDSSTITSENTSKEQTTGGSVQSQNKTGWAGAHIQLLESSTEEQMKKWILLDSQSSATIFCNEEMVENIRPSNNGNLTLVTNGGIIQINEKADLPGWGEVWFSRDSVTNIFSHAEMAMRHRVTYDNEKEDVFIVHLPHKQVRFSKMANNLYVFQPNQKMSDSTETKLSMVTTVEENKSFYTQRQFERAKKARDLYHAIGTPSINDFKAILRMNSIANNPVTTKDIELAEKIFGPDVSTIKGKTTRRTPAPVVEDYIEIPTELIQSQQYVTLCADGMKVNGVPFLTTISRNLYYRTAQWISSQTPAVYKEAFGQVITLYNRGGFKVNRIHVDNEFRPLTETLHTDFDVILNFANPQEHVPEAERNNRVMKERVRAVYHRLPFRKLPRLLVRAIVQEAAKKLNFFPAKHGVSKYYSPRMILHQRNLDYNRHCQYTLGMYVQAHNEPDPTNTNAPRSLDCIYLRYNDNDQGGHECLHMQTNRVITRRRVTPIPITPAVISQVHSIADQEGMPEGLKIQNRFGTILYDSAWIAGVDYDPDEFDDEDYTSDDDSEASGETDNESAYDEVEPDEIAALEEVSVEHNVDELHNPAIELENPPNENVEEDDIEESGDEDDEESNPSTVEVNDSDEEAEEEESTEIVTRSGRVSRMPASYEDYHLHLQTQAHPLEEYSTENARVIAIIMCHMNNQFYNTNNPRAEQFVQTYSLAKGIKKFKERGRKAAFGEMKQLHDRVVFEPIRVEELTPTEKRRAMESLIFLVEKRDGTVKARTCANGSTQREYVDREDAASPTAMTESILITATIDAKQERDVMTADIPNAFVQTDIERAEIGKRIIMKIRGSLVDMLIEMAPEIYERFVVIERGQKVLYVLMLKALYGMLQSSLLYYKKFRKDIEEIGFQVNPYDICVANRMVNGRQHTVTWHVDDLKSSHVDAKVNDDFLKWLEIKYGSVAKVKAVRGTRHDYLAMILDFSTPGVVKVDMTEYIKKMVNEFPEELSSKVKCPWTEKLFKVDEGSKRLDKARAKVMHTFVMKGMFVCKRGRQDIQTGIVFLATRVKEPTEQDWIKLTRIMGFLKATQYTVAALEADDTQKISWWVDAAFAVHNDFRSHTGAYMSLGKGAIISVSTKQKVNSRSSTEAELIGLDDVVSKILWTKRFIEAQGFEVPVNVVYRDNTSSMKLEQNGRASASKRTRHFNIKYFFVTDLIEKKELQIEYCPTDQMGADYLTKPLAGSSFNKFRNRIMNMSPEIVGQQECVGG